MDPATLAFLLGIAAAPPRPAIDFNLQREKSAGNSSSASPTYIRRGASKIFLRVPPTWHDFSDAQTITLTPDRSQASVRIKQVNTFRPVTLNESCRVELRRQARAFLPDGATDVASASETSNVLPLAGWTSFENVFTYRFFGSSFQQAVILLKLPDNHLLRITVVSEKQDFATVREQALKVMSSWFEPAKDLPPDIAQQMAQNSGA